jgi:hypothetical protein
MERSSLTGTKVKKREVFETNVESRDHRQKPLRHNAGIILSVDPIRARDGQIAWIGAVR